MLNTVLKIDTMIENALNKQSKIKQAIATISRELIRLCFAAVDSIKFETKRYAHGTELMAFALGPPNAIVYLPKRIKWILRSPNCSLLSAWN